MTQETQIAKQLAHIDFFEREAYLKHIVSLIASCSDSKAIERHKKVVITINEINTKQQFA